MWNEARMMSGIGRLVAGVLLSLLAAGSTGAQEPTTQPGVDLQNLSGSEIAYEIMGDGTIILKGDVGDLEILEALIRQLDADAERPVIRYVQLENASARDLSGRLQSLYQSMQRSTRPQDRIIIVADEGSNSLLIAAPAAQIDEIIALAEQLDTIPRIPWKEYEVIKLDFIPASDAAEQLDEALQNFKKQVGATQSTQNISIVPNDRNNTLIITAPKEDIEQIKALLKMIDVEPVGLAKAELLFIPLLNARAEDLAKSLTDMFTTQGQQAKELREKILRLRFTKVGPKGELEPLPELDLEKPIRIAAEPGTNSLIVATHDQNVQPLTEIVKLLDSVPTAPEMGFDFFPLKYADAKSVADALQKMFDSGKKLPEGPGGKKIADGIVPEGIQGKAFVYNVGITADTRTNTVVVSGRPEQLAVARTVIAQFDIEGDIFFASPRLLYLEHTAAERLADVMTQLNERSVQALEARQAGPAAIEKEKALILPEIRSNALIIMATDAKYKELSELAQKLDTESDRFLNEIRFIPCQNTNAADLVSKVTELWKRKQELLSRENLPIDLPVIVADQRSNSLVVASNVEDFDAIKKLVTDLEAQPLAPLAMVRLIEVKNNDAGELGNMLKQIFDERLQQRPTTGGQENNIDRVAITSDSVTNTMLIASSPANYDEIKALVEKLDVLPELAGVVQSFVLKNADAANVADKVKELLDQGIYTPAASSTDRGGQAEKQWTEYAIIADARSNAVMISASKPLMSIVEQLIQQMDGVDAAALTGDTRIFKLAHADAVKAADVLTQVFKGLKANTTNQEVFIEPTIIPVEGSNALIVAGSRDAMVRTEDLLTKIDQPSTTPSSVFKVYTLIHAPALKVAPRVQEMFDKREEGTDAKRTPFLIQAIEGSNSLIISAAADDQLVVEDLVARLDVPSNLNQQLRIFNLQRAKAEQTATVLTDLFQSQSEGADGLANAIAVQAVPWTNSLLVWAAPGQLEDIEKMIVSLDTNEPTREMTFDVIQLQQAAADKLTEAIQEAFTQQTSGEGGTDAQTALILSFLEQMPDGSSQLRKLIQQDITIVPWLPTNSLMVMAPPDSLEMLKTLIKRLDNIPPLTAEVVVFPLKNAAAEQVIENLEKIFNEQTNTGGEDVQLALTTGGTGSVSGVGGITQSITFAADQRTNSVIAAGHPQYLKTVRGLIEKLDATETDERSNFVYPAQYKPAEDIAEAIAEFNTKEKERLGDIDDATNAQLLAERQITVVPVPSSNAIALGMSKRYQDQYMKMVEELDTPPEQVLIEFMLVEVSTNDIFELGVEFAAQDLLFSEQAYVGNNGTIKGPDFDFVGGTDLGAAGSGRGFSFTMTGEDFNFLFHALQSNGKAELISRPSMMVENNAEDAEIAITTNVPTLRSLGSDNAGNPVTQIDYQDAGIKLRAVPRINPDGFVQLALESEVSSVGAPIQVGNTSSVSISRTGLNTTVTIKDGESVIIGGLIQSEIQENEQKLPFLGDIPGAGLLFSARNNTGSRKELLIVITATVIRGPEEAHRISERERDRTTIIPEHLLRDPLMNKMQLQPDAPRLEIRDQELLKREEEDAIEEYGPQPSIYGPPVPSQGLQQVQYRS
ncbi:MAG: hypothetical protein HJJLKODD_00524 [Phycisphaerae bacterium]|nr:hypothetical protein [Phycisphaerae bacterium]